MDATNPSPSAAEPPRAFGPFVLDVQQARLLRDGVPVPLPGRPFDVLALLVRQAGRLVGKDEVLDGVWGHRHVSESVLKTAVNQLRDALGDDARQPRYVETVPRRGYRFVAPVQALDAAPAVAVPAPMPVPVPMPAPVPAAPVPPAAGNLPAQTDVLVGRETELAQLAGLLQTHRLVTLTGLGGVGKTRLALAAAAAAGSQPDGVWLLRLEDLDDPALLPSTLAALLQLGQVAAGGVPALVRAMSGLTLRLVLDNAEHLAAAVAELAAALLAAAPGVQMLVTSQLPLRLRAERVLPLAPLGLPADLADDAPPPQGYAAARLLCERIAQQRAHWQPTPADHADIAAICRALDGVPLALELAAARVPLLGLAGVRARLDERFALLTRGARDAATRHRTLAAALDWTFSLLQPHEREALHRLAVFAGSFTLADAEGVLADAPEPLDTVDELHARSLLVSAQDPNGDGARLRLYDSVRRHALAGLGRSGRETEARRRHLQWLLHRFEHLHTTDLFEPLLTWLPTVQADVDSLRAALRFGLEEQAEPEDLRCGVLLFAGSVPFWYRSGRRAEGAAWLQRAQAAAPRAGLSALEQAVLQHASAVFVAYAQLGDPTQALAWARGSRAALAAAGERQRVYLSHYIEHALVVRVEPGADLEPVALATEQALDPRWPPTVSRHALIVRAVLSRNRRDFLAYLRLGEQLMAQAAAPALAYERWAGANVVGQALLLLGRRDEACDHYARTVDGIRAAGWLRGQVATVAMGAALALRRRLDADSRERALEALRVLAGEGMVWWMADALPWAAWHDGRPGDAARLQAWADQLALQRKDRRGPIFQGMRDDLVQVLGPAGLAPEGAVLPAGDGEAIELALGAGCAATLYPPPAWPDRNQTAA